MRCHHSAQGFASDLRTQPRLFRRFGATIRLGFRLLPFTSQHPASAGNSKIFAMRRFWSRNLRLDRLGVNHRYLSVRYHALRRSLALAADKTPFLPRTGDSFFREERSKGQFDRLPSRTPQHGVRDLGCAFIASTSGPIRTAGGDLPPTRLCRRMERKCYRHLKFRAVIPALIPRLCRGEFCGQRASENLVDFPKPGARRCLSDARISTDEGAITQARSVRKNEHNFLLIFRTPLRPSKSGRSCNIFL